MALHLDPLEVEHITTATTARDIDKWDSLNHLKLIMELEKRLHLEFDDNEIVELGSVDAIMQSIQRKRL